jgi:hypothetical protein
VRIGRSEKALSSRKKAEKTVVVFEVEGERLEFGESRGSLRADGIGVRDVVSVADEGQVNDAVERKLAFHLSKVDASRLERTVGRVGVDISRLVGISVEIGVI